MDLASVARVQAVGQLRHRRGIDQLGLISCSTFAAVSHKASQTSRRTWSSSRKAMCFLFMLGTHDGRFRAKNARFNPGRRLIRACSNGRELCTFNPAEKPRPFVDANPSGVIVGFAI
jgi:hypothetical protein